MTAVIVIAVTMMYIALGGLRWSCQAYGLNASFQHSLFQGWGRDMQ